MDYKRIFCLMTGSIYIPEEVKQIKGKKLLHISDTPLCIFNELERLIKKIKPDYIIHTGDIVDDIKLELYPTSILRYEKYVKVIISIMENSKAEDIYVALGNHDDRATVEKHRMRCNIIDKADDIEVEGISCRISHYSKEILKSPKDMNFFGHDLSLKSGEVEGKQFYNGITGINIVDLETGESHALWYPWGTDDARLGRSRIGL